MVIIHVHAITLWQEEGEVNTSYLPQSESAHDCNIALILWVGIFSEGPCPQTNPLRMSLKYKTVAHGVHLWCVWPCLCRKLNGG